MSRARSSDPNLVDVRTYSLDFESERDRETESWRRADPSNALIEHPTRYGYRVMIKGGDVHYCALARENGRENGRYRGRCDCKGFEFHDGPCAHLCVLRKAEFIHEVDVLDVDDLDDEHQMAQSSGAVFADGGEDGAR